jgi:hypothetical protein
MNNKYSIKDGTIKVNNNAIRKELFDKLTTEMQMLQTQLQMQQMTNPVPPEGAEEDIP